MVETGHFPSWSLIEIRKPCNSSSQTFSTVPAFPSVKATDLPIRRERASWYALRIVAACGTSTVKLLPLFFANKCFRPFAAGASKPGEVRTIFSRLVKHNLHRSPTSRTVRRPFGSQWIKQKVLVGFHGAAPVAARFTTAEAPDGCHTVRGQQLPNLAP
jgi:hypothetical protein